MFWKFFKKPKNISQQRSDEEISRIFINDFLKLANLSEDQALEKILEEYRKAGDKELEECVCYHWTENHPYNWKAYYSLGRFHFEGGDLDLAAGFFQQALNRAERTYEFEGDISKEELENLDKEYFKLREIIKEPPITHCILAHFMILFLIKSGEYLERDALEDILESGEILETMLIGLIRFPDEAVYGKIFNAPCHAALILTEIKSKNAIPFFINLLDYDGDILRENTSHGLAKLSDDYPEIIDELFEVIISDQYTWGSKIGAAEILGWTLPKYHSKIEKFILDIFQNKKYWKKAKTKQKESGSFDGVDLPDFLIYTLKDIKSIKGIEILEKFYQKNKDWLEKGTFGSREFKSILEDLRKIKNKEILEFDFDPRERLDYDIFETLCQKKPLKIDKISRNSSCPCGSGKKYKRCCGV